MIDKAILMLESVGGGAIFEALNLRAAGASTAQALFVIMCGLFVFLYGLSLGKTRAFISLIGIYMAFVFDTLFPYLGELYKFTNFPRPMYELRAIMFLGLYAAICILLNRSFFKGRFTLKEHAFWVVTLLNLVQVGFLTSVFISFYPTEVGERYLGLAFPFFGSQLSLFLWSMAPLILLPFFRHKKEYEDN